MTLTRWEPLRELTTLRQAMDRLLDDVWTGPVNGGAPLAVPIDVLERNDEVEVRATVPGFRAGDIDVAVQGDVLTLSGHTDTEEEKNEGDFYIRERRRGSFHRSVRLPAAVDSDAANARYENGELTLVLPKRADAVARRIEIKG